MSIISNTKKSLGLAAVLLLFTTTVLAAETPPTANQEQTELYRLTILSQFQEALMTVMEAL